MEWEWIHVNWPMIVGWTTLVFGGGINVQMLRQNSKVLKDVQENVKQINGNVREHGEKLAMIEGVCPNLKR